MSADFHTRLVEQLVVSVRKHLHVQIEAMFSNADSIIATLPEAFGFSKQECTEVSQLLSVSKADIAKNYMLQIRTQLQATTLSDVSQHPDNAYEFIEQEEVDVMVAITAIHSDAINAYGDSVQQLEARLEYLEITTDASFDKQAISPKQLCESFHDALVVSKIENSHILVLLKLYDKTINRQLSEMYDDLNTSLIKADVLPDIVLSSYSEGGGEHAEMQSRTASYYNPQDKKQNAFIERSESEQNYFAMRCISGDMTICENSIDLPESFKTEPSVNEIDGKNCYARKDVVVALSKLQQALIEDDSYDVDLTTDSNSVDIGVIKSSLFNSMHGQHDSSSEDTDAHVNLLDERSIDFVGMMFDVIAEDDIIPSLIKAQLMRLQIPVIKVSITDKTLFEDADHPVRNVLNLITEVGQGIVSEEDDVYIKLSTVVTKLLKEYYMDIISFKRAEKELRALHSRKEAVIRKKEQEEQRKIIKKHARNVVLTELKCLSAKKTIPKVIQPLVLKYLPTVMMNQYVLHGRDSAQWVKSASLLKQLIQCVQPLKKNDEWVYLKDNESVLIESLYALLCKPSQDKQTITALLDSLHQLFKEMMLDFGFKNVEDSTDAVELSEIVNDMEIIKSNSVVDDKMPGFSPDDYRIILDDSDEHVESSEGSVENSGSSDFSSAEQELQEALSLAQKKIENLPEQVHPGVWFEIYNGEEHSVRRLKLSVIFNDTAKVVFSDRRGNTVMEKDAGEFTEELASNKSKLIADHSTFENALGCVLASFAA